MYKVSTIKMNSCSYLKKRNGEEGKKIATRQFTGNYIQLYDRFLKYVEEFNENKTEKEKFKKIGY
jgi:hypothetical protein